MGVIQNIKAQFNTPEVYGVFSECMYKPTWDKFDAKAKEYMNNLAISIFGCYEENYLAGVIVVDQKQGEEPKIKGIAVDSSHRKNGVGKKLIQHVCEELSLSTLTAETDDDAVGFYRRCGFDTTEFMRTGDNGVFKRYKCIFRRNI